MPLLVIRNRTYGDWERLLRCLTDSRWNVLLCGSISSSSSGVYSMDNAPTITSGSVLVDCTSTSAGCTELPLLITENQNLNREMASMHIESAEYHLEEKCENDRKMMPPPALPFRRNALSDIKNRGKTSPVSSKHFSRHSSKITASDRAMQPRIDSVFPPNRKRTYRSPIEMEKRSRKVETIHEHNETVTFAGPTIVRSSAGLKKEMHAYHNDENIHEVSYRLAVLNTVDSPAYRRITSTTLSQLMRTEGDEFQKRFALIDCRYPYEYEGGHIKGATNVFDPAHVEQHYFSSLTSLLKRKEENGEGKTQKIPIFYCEYSQVRGPGMAKAVRKFDRTRNAHMHPHCDHPEMYVLEGGYRGFYHAQGCEDLCSPAHSYMPMHENPEELKKFNFHKKGAACGTVSRLQRPALKHAKPSQSSPISAARRVNRRALLFAEETTVETIAEEP